MSAFVELPARGAPIPVLVSIPHTGTELPDDIAERFASDEIRKLPMTDWHLHQLYDFLPELGIGVIHARYSRLLADLNRPPDGASLYPGRFETALVATETFDGDRIFREPPDPQTIERWRCRYHKPYHTRLAEMLQGALDQFGRVVLIDAHSVASRANKLHSALERDIYLGDRDGASCQPWLSAALQHDFMAAGLRVQMNDPYKGGYITHHYGQQAGVDALQIEMCQRIYMDEDNPNMETEEKRNSVKSILIDVFAALAQRLERN